MGRLELIQALTGWSWCDPCRGLPGGTERVEAGAGQVVLWYSTQGSPDESPEIEAGVGLVFPGVFCSCVTLAR